MSLLSDTVIVGNIFETIQVNYNQHRYNDNNNIAVPILNITKDLRFQNKSVQLYATDMPMPYIHMGQTWTYFSCAHYTCTFCGSYTLSYTPKYNICLLCVSFMLHMVCLYNLLGRPNSAALGSLIK